MESSKPKKKGGKPIGKKKKKVTVEEMVTLMDDPKQRQVIHKEAYADFIRWDILTIAEKKKEKQPKTQGEFAKKWDIGQDTISNWKNRAEFQKLRSEMFRKKLASDVPEVMADMRKRIKKIGKADEVELWLAYSEGWDRKRVVEIKQPVEFGEGDIRTLVSKLPEDKQKTFYVTLAKLLAEAENSEDGL